jgi:hypothetical protein
VGGPLLPEPPLDVVQCTDSASDYENNWDGDGQPAYNDSDSDNDGLSDGDEARLGTSPNNANTDGDACSDLREVGPNKIFGGQRDPLNRWDFFDVSGDAFVDLTDALDVLSYFGQPAPPGGLADLRDRDAPIVAQPWRTFASNTGVDLTDALNNLVQFGHDC